MVQSRAVAGAIAVATLLTGCSGDGAAPAGGPPPPVTIDGYTVTVRPGVVDVGSGVNSLAVLATVRDAAGEGPPGPWFARPYGPAGFLDAVPGQYDAPGPGSYAEWEWQPIHVGDGSATKFYVGPTDLKAAAFDIAVDPRSSVAIPSLRLSPDGNRVEWDPVPGAASYDCEVATTSLVLETRGTEPWCDVSTLGDGSFSVTVAALSVDLDALAASRATVPMLPSRYDVAIGRLGLHRPDPASAYLTVPLEIRTAGGALRVGNERRLLIWASVTTTTGEPLDQEWWVDLQCWDGGPWPTALGPYVYPPGVAQYLFVDLDEPALATQYDVDVGRWGVGGQTWFTIGAPAELPEPQNVTVSAVTNGGATVTWSGVAGARSHLVRAYDPATGLAVAQGWTKSSPFAFPTGSFAAGTSYDVYVLATDADMIGGAVPLQVGATETATPVSFIAR